MSPPSYAEDPARDCTALATTHQEINVSSGIYTERAVAVVPLKIKVPTGADPGLEESCLEVDGRGTGSRITAEFDRADACRQAASGVRLRSADAAGSPRIGGSFDADAYDACLQEGEIEVEVLGDD